MSTDLLAHASVNIDAPRDEVWDALVNPLAIEQYMFGAQVVTDWQKGSPIVWKGEWKGSLYEDKGEILKFQPGRSLCYSHFSPRSGLPDRPDNYHNVAIELSDRGKQTHVSLVQDGNATNAAREHSEKNWGMMLQALKEFVEGSNHDSTQS